MILLPEWFDRHSSLFVLITGKQCPDFFEKRFAVWRNPCLFQFGQFPQQFLFALADLARHFHHDFNQQISLPLTLRAGHAPKFSGPNDELVIHEESPASVVAIENGIVQAIVVRKVGRSLFAELFSR